MGAITPNDPNSQIDILIKGFAEGKRVGFDVRKGTFKDITGKPTPEKGMETDLFILSETIKNFVDANLDRIDPDKLTKLQQAIEKRSESLAKRIGVFTGKAVKQKKELLVNISETFKTKIKSLPKLQQGISTGATPVREQRGTSTETTPLLEGAPKQRKTMVPLPGMMPPAKTEVEGSPESMEGPFADMPPPPPPGNIPPPPPLLMNAQPKKVELFFQGESKAPDYDPQNLKSSDKPLKDQMEEIRTYAGVKIITKNNRPDVVDDDTIGLSGLIKDVQTHLKEHDKIDEELKAERDTLNSLRTKKENGTNAFNKLERFEKDLKSNKSMLPVVHLNWGQKKLPIFSDEFFDLIPGPVKKFFGYSDVNKLSFAKDQLKKLNEKRTSDITAQETIVEDKQKDKTNFEAKGFRGIPYDQLSTTLAAKIKLRDEWRRGFKKRYDQSTGKTITEAKPSEAAERVQQYEQMPAFAAAGKMDTALSAMALKNPGGLFDNVSG